MSSANPCYHKFSVYTAGIKVPIISPTPVETRSGVFRKFPNTHEFSQVEYQQYLNDTKSQDQTKRGKSCGYQLASDSECFGNGGY